VRAAPVTLDFFGHLIYYHLVIMFQRAG